MLCGKANALSNEDDLGQPVAVGRTFRNEKHLQEKEAGLGFCGGRETMKSSVDRLRVLGRMEGNMRRRQGGSQNTRAGGFLNVAAPQKHRAQVAPLQ